MNCPCTLGKHLNEDFWRDLTQSRLQRWPVQVLWGGKAASLQMDCHWASKVEVPFPFFPLPYVLLVQSLTQFFLQCLASIKFILELSLFHDSFSGLALASTSIHSGLPPGTLSSLATSAGVSFPLTLPRSGVWWKQCSFHKITSSFILSFGTAGPNHCEECWGRKTGEATHSKQAFLLCFSFELKLHTSVSLKYGLKSYWS